MTEHAYHTLVQLGRRSRAWWRDEDQRLRRNALIALAVLALLPSAGLGIYICPFHFLTGTICPACGLTRSMSSLLHGHVSTAFLYHPLGIVVLVWLSYVAFSGRSLPQAWSRLPATTRQLGVAGAIVGVLLIWLIRVSLDVTW